MSSTNVSPLTDDRASFEHGKAAGQHAAQQLGASSPLSQQQLAWLNGFLDGLVSGSLGPKASEAVRANERSDLQRSDLPRSDLQRSDLPREPLDSGVRMDTPHADSGSWFDATRPDSMRADALRSQLRPDALRPETLRPETLRPDAFRSEAPPPGANVGFESAANFEAATRQDAFLRGDAARFEPSARVGAVAYPGHSLESAMGPSPVEGVIAARGATDLAAHVRATLATTGKRALADETRSKYSADNPFAARIVHIIANQARNPSAWRLTLDVESSGLRCRPGDVLGVVPSNDPDLVRRLLRRLGAKGQETVTTSRGTGPAWRALLEEFSITQVTKELLWVLASSTRNTSEAQKLESLANGSTPGADTALASILRRFPGARPSLNDFVNSLCPLVPQYYPLASARSRQADTLEILAAKHPNETRSVVHQLHQEKLAQGDWLPIFVDAKPHVHPPTDITAPVILLAPGVGAACAFAFLAERAATRGSGRNWLFTSPIDGETEVAYAEHFAAWQTSRIIGRLDVSPTQQLGKRLFDHGEMVQAWVVDGSYLYIYGTKSDCNELEQALAQLLVMRARITQEEAQKRLDAMRTSGQLRINTVS